MSFPQNNEKSGKKANKKSQSPRQKPIKSQTPPADQRKLNTKTSQPSSQDESSLDEGSSDENEDDSDVEEYKADFHNYKIVYSSLQMKKLLFHQSFLLRTLPNF